MNYPRIALGLVNAHRIAPMVYVMFSSTVAPPRDTECTNVPHGPQADTFLANELPSAIEHAFRIEPHRWGVVGDSTGGYCAAKLAMFHPGTFAGGISLSGYYYALSDFTTGNLWGGSLAREHDNNLEWVLGHRPAPRANLFVTIGKNEFGTQGYVDTMRFVHLVKPPMRVTALVEQVGGHNFRTWGRELPTALAWLSHLTTAA
jgi:S-formylglutathione hydrolase FrmB